MAGTGFTVQSVIDQARTRMNDDAKKRASDAKCEVWINECLGTMVLLAPHLFTRIVELKPVAGQIHQNAALNMESPVDPLGPNVNVVSLQKIIGTMLGMHLHECDYHAAMTSNPLHLITPGIPRNWARVPEEERAQNPTTYFLFPPPSTNGNIMALVVIAPDYITLASGEKIYLPDPYRALFVSYLLYVFNSVDDDYIVSQRAAQELQHFMTLLGLAIKTKDVKE